jgi:hypothetical protein
MLEAVATLSELAESNVDKRICIMVTPAFRHA